MENGFHKSDEEEGEKNKKDLQKDKQPGKKQKQRSSIKSNQQELNKQMTDMRITHARDKCLTLAGEKLIIKANGTSYECNKVIGNGSFGVVYQATEIGRDRKTYNGQVVAIKRVLQDRRYKNRELQIMKMVHHPNVVNLQNSFYEHEKHEVYLNLVLEFMPQTLYKYARQFSKQKKPIPVLQIQLYIYQLCRALAYIHSLGICHRDIKPQNLLIDPRTHQLKLCDFGSAKILVQGEPNVSYICSRYYRAPELIFGATNYTQAIDIWSTGCVMAELIIGQPLFPGESGVDQLVEIIKVLGTPTREQIQSMNPNYKEFKFPQIKPHPWSKVFPSWVSNSCVEIISRMLEYTPNDRISPLEACAHEFFNTFRQPDTRLPNGNPLPVLFNFSPEEIANANQKNLLDVIIPPHARNPTFNNS